MAPSLNALGLAPLCNSLLIALKLLSRAAASRAVTAFLKVVEITVGPTRMTRQDQRNAISQVGKCVGAITRKNSAVGEDLRSKVAFALLLGTEDGDTFNDAYIAALAAEQVE